MNIPLKYRDGNVIQEGTIIIEGVAHQVIFGFVACNRTLNNKPWNTTEKISECKECNDKYQRYINQKIAPDKVEIPYRNDKPKQLSLF